MNYLFVLLAVVLCISLVMYLKSRSSKKYVKLEPVKITQLPEKEIADESEALRRVEDHPNFGIDIVEVHDESLAVILQPPVVKKSKPRTKQKPKAVAPTTKVDRSTPPVAKPKKPRLPKQ
jgi:hypothetical protein